MIAKLKEDWSPEQISGRIGIDHPGLSVSHEAIYQYIYHPFTPDREELIGCLRRSHRRRNKKGAAPDKHKPKIVNRIGIEHRPPEADTRNEFGHWEADTLVSRKSLVALVSLVERKSRRLILEKIDRKTARQTSQAIINRLFGFPKDALRTITFDNGTEHADHQDISKATNIQCFFCDLYSAWQRGTNEHTNGLVRGYLPKGTDFSKITEEEIAWIDRRATYTEQSRLNSVSLRARSCPIGYNGPRRSAPVG
ncbi:IS30 family transposase [candidate division WOR-3 bacterium]|nr:IS30 family transposase [candidate division WOR-3 bacterium]